MVGAVIQLRGRETGNFIREPGLCHLEMSNQVLAIPLGNAIGDQWNCCCQESKSCQ